MPRAVGFDHYGGIDVLEVVDVERPKANVGEVLARVKAAGIGPGEAAIACMCALAGDVSVGTGQRPR